MYLNVTASVMVCVTCLLLDKIRDKPVIGSDIQHLLDYWLISGGFCPITDKFKKNCSLQ